MCESAEQIAARFNIPVDQVRVGAILTPFGFQHPITIVACEPMLEPWYWDETYG